MDESLTNKPKTVKLVIMIGLPIIVGLLSAFLTGDAMIEYGDLVKPPLAPPAWLFPTAWTVLYVLMGLGSYFLLVADTDTEQQFNDRRTALIIYFIQLGFNFGWSLFFFLGKFYIFSFIWLMIMWVMIIALVVKSSRVCTKATLMFVPYLLWTTFAAYLNVMIAILN